MLVGLGVGAVAGAAGQVWHGQAGFLWPIGAALSTASAAGLAAIVLRVSAVRPLRGEPQPLFFRVAAIWLVTGTGLHLLSVLTAEGAIVPLAESRLETELLIRGFVLNTIIAVGLRAFPGHLELRPVTARRQAIVLATINGSLVAWAASSGAFGLPDSAGLQEGADLALAGGLLGLTAWLGVLSPLRHPGHGPRIRVLVPVAWCGLVVYAIALIAAVTAGGADEMSLYQEGGVRHIFMLGYMAPLMIAMAHVVLARFGTGRVKWEPLLTTAFIVLMAGWPLRVAPVLFADSPGEIGRAVLGAAAALTAVALVGLGIVALATALQIRQTERWGTNSTR